LIGLEPKMPYNPINRLKSGRYIKISGLIKINQAISSYYVLKNL
jgi:hypothetical protein